jgi:hypothetical protein
MRNEAYSTLEPLIKDSVKRAREYMTQIEDKLEGVSTIFKLYLSRVEQLT